MTHYIGETPEEEFVRKFGSLKANPQQMCTDCGKGWIDHSGRDEYNLVGYGGYCCHKDELIEQKGEEYMAPKLDPKIAELTQAETKLVEAVTQLFAPFLHSTSIQANSRNAIAYIKAGIVEATLQLSIPEVGSRVVYNYDGGTYMGRTTTEQGGKYIVKLDAGDFVIFNNAKEMKKEV